MSEILVDFAAASDDAAIRALLRRQPMPGPIRLTFEREPDFSHGCAITGDDYRIVVARSPQGEIAGVACRSTRRVFLNGSEQRIGYLGQLRLDPRFRGRWLVARGFNLLAGMDREDPLPAYLLSIVDGNDQAEGVLVRKRRPSFPAVHQAAEFRTFALGVRRQSRRSGTHVVEQPEKLEEIAAFLCLHGRLRQLFPVWSGEALRRLEPFGLSAEDMRIVRRRDGEIAGVAALWDQRSYKQAVVRGYSGWMRAAAWLGRGVLPRVGEELRSAYLSLVCVAGDDRGVFATLVDALQELARERGFDYLLAGFDTRDPLLPVLRARARQTYRSRLYLAAWSQGGTLHDLLDQRPLAVDIATL